jgi:Fe-S-cluster containining protein
LKSTAGAACSTMEDRVEHWLACREKSCCSYFLVYVTGDDAARIARSLAVPPWQITAAIEADASFPDAFALARGMRYRLALVRTQFPGEAQPECEFLVHAADGAARCGLGEGRPMPCRSFPAQLVDGEVRYALEGCTCDWSDVAIEADRDTALLRAEVHARERYAVVVAQWNAYVDTLERTVDVTHRDFCRFLMDAYPA